MGLKRNVQNCCREEYLQQNIVRKVKVRCNCRFHIAVTADCNSDCCQQKAFAENACGNTSVVPKNVIAKHFLC